MVKQIIKNETSKTLNYITVFITGMAVMFLEILGTRIIGPFYGVSLFVWTSLISVTLVSLAIGYYLGGLIADKKRCFLSVYLIVGAAASFIAIIPIIDIPVLAFTNSFGIRLGTLTSAFLLFAIPLALLGMIGPYIIRLNASQLEKVGVTSGSVFAISTIGSFLGTLSIGFLLLPMVGTRNIVYILSGVLFMLSLSLMIKERFAVKSTTTASSIVTVIIFFIIIAVSFGFNKATLSNTGRKFDVIYEAESLYGKAKVVDDHRWGVRWLISDSSTIGGQFLKSSYPVLPFLYILESVRFFNPAGQRALLIGLGAGYLPKALKKRNIVTDVIEIDPKIAFAAQAYFDFKPPGKLIIGDARFHIKELQEKYDFIIHDTFTGGSVPSHLLSVEMIRNLKSLLNNKGIFALVYYGFSEGEKALAASAVNKTINSVFPFAKVYVSKKGTEPVDLIFVASMNPLRFQMTPDEKYSDPLAREILDNMDKLEKILPPNKGFVITDDYNPLESLQSRKAEAYREKVLKLTGSEMLLD